MRLLCQLGTTPPVHFTLIHEYLGLMCRCHHTLMLLNTGKYVENWIFLDQGMGRLRGEGSVDAGC